MSLQCALLIFQQMRRIRGLTEEIRKTNEAGCSNLVQDKPAGWRHFNLTGSAVLLKKRKTNA